MQDLGTSLRRHHLIGVLFRMPDNASKSAEAASGRETPPSGLDQLKALIGAGQEAPIAQTLNFRLVAIEAGFAVFEGTPLAHVYNPAGTAHGGYAAAILDSACACAVQSKLDLGQPYTTLELKIAYHRAITEADGPVRAEGRIMTIGRRTAFVEAKLTDKNGRLCASATSTLMIL
ncbi:MAG TPA: PaaI family thioesterase [Sphingopyxis sp.]|nr:PaaI family thioesterase [Sphingopyxis sp.]